MFWQEGEYVVPEKGLGQPNSPARNCGGQCGRVKCVYGHSGVVEVKFATNLGEHWHNSVHISSHRLRRASRSEILLYKLMGGK